MDWSKILSGQTRVLPLKLRKYANHMSQGSDAVKNLFCINFAHVSSNHRILTTSSKHSLISHVDTSLLQTLNHTFRYTIIFGISWYFASILFCMATSASRSYLTDIKSFTAQYIPTTSVRTRMSSFISRNGILLSHSMLSNLNHFESPLQLFPSCTTR